MIDPLDARTFTNIVEDLGWPASTCGQLSIDAGREAWEAILPRFGRPERLWTLRSLEAALLSSTPGGRQRWQASRGVSGITPLMTASELLEWLDDRLVFVGDDALRPIVLDGLATCPEPVQDAAVLVAAWQGVGIESRAWTASSRHVDKEGRERWRVVNLGPAVDVEVVRHEAAHVWHSRVLQEGDTPPPAITTQGEAAIKTLAATEGWFQPHDDAYWREERICCALALLWSRP